MNVTELLKTTTTWFKDRGIESARLDAELLLAETLKLGRMQLYTSFDRPVDPTELDAFRALVRRRGKHEPVAYILGEREFYGRPFAVDPRVLIPRPDTEVLVDEVLLRLASDTEGVVLDYGTGSGAIALTLAAERPGLKLLALDVSPDALAVARANAESLELAERVGFVRSDGFERVPPRFAGQLRALVANPPYIDPADKASLMPDVREHEPGLALFSEDPLAHYRRIAEAAAHWLAPGGLVALEVGQGQAPAVAALLADGGLVKPAVREDLGGVERVVLASRPE